MVPENIKPLMLFACIYIKREVRSNNSAARFVEWNVFDWVAISALKTSVVNVMANATMDAMALVEPCPSFIESDKIVWQRSIIKLYFRKHKCSVEKVRIKPV